MLGVSYTPQKIIQPLDFSFEAFASARWQGLSEAWIIAQENDKKKGSSGKNFFRGTLRNKRRKHGDFVYSSKKNNFSRNEKIGVMSFLYHFKRVISLFKERIPEVKPVFAEDFLAMDGQLDCVVNYYEKSRGSQEWPVERIKELLSNERSLIELL